MNTTLDTLKHTVLRVESLIEHGIDMVGGSMCGHDHEDALEILDAAREELWRRLAEHVPDVARFRHNDGLTYDDGTPVRRHVKICEDMVAEYFPRLDGNVNEHIARFTPPRPRLEIVEVD